MVVVMIDERGDFAVCAKDCGNCGWWNALRVDEIVHVGAGGEGQENPSASCSDALMSEEGRQSWNMKRATDNYENARGSEIFSVLS